MTRRTTPSEPTGQLPIDPLVDRTCVLLDGRCDCVEPWYDCKHVHHPDGNQNVYKVIQAQQMKEWNI